MMRSIFLVCLAWAWPAFGQTGGEIRALPADAAAFVQDALDCAQFTEVAKKFEEHKDRDEQKKVGRTASLTSMGHDLTKWALMVGKETGKSDKLLGDQADAIGQRVLKEVNTSNLIAYLERHIPYCTALHKNGLELAYRLTHGGKDGLSSSRNPSSSQP
jgi:hypothetical protein